MSGKNKLPQLSREFVRNNAHFIGIGIACIFLIAITTWAIFGLEENHGSKIETKETGIVAEVTKPSDSTEPEETTTEPDGTTIPDTQTESTTTETTTSATTTTESTTVTTCTYTENIVVEQPVIEEIPETVPETETEEVMTEITVVETEATETTSDTGETTESSSSDETATTVATETQPEETTTETVLVATRPVIYDCTLSDDLQQYIYDNCNANGVPYEFVMAIIKKESTFRTNASNGSCVGLMQLNSRYNTGLANSLGVSLYDPYGNVLVGIHVVKDLLNKYSMSDALMCYNMGEYGAKKYLGGSTSYSRTVMSYYYEYIG